MTPSLLSLMRSVDTPTICNAIEVAQGQRGFSAFTQGTMLCSAPDAPPVVGYARTARIAALSPPTEDAEVIRSRRMAYYRYMADGPSPSVAVVEDVDYPDCIGAYWGEINTSIHKGFGLSGALTNGVMRDLGDLPDGFPVIAGSVGPSHGFVHVRAVDVPVTIHGMPVAPGDLIHADRHGALVVPPDSVAQLEGAVEKLLQTERIVLDAAARPDFNFEQFQDAWAAFEKART